MNSEIRIVRDYPHPRTKVWRALTEPKLMALWGMRPDGFAPIVGTKFKLVAKPQPGWRGFVDCEVTEARAPSLIAYSWVGNEGQKPMHLSYTLEETASGTRVTLLHVGFVGIGGFFLSKLMMGPGWKKMLSQAIPRVLDDMTDDGELRAGSTLAPKFP